jgi:hypothetical protein
MAPSSSIHKRTGATLHEVFKGNRRAGQYRLEDHGWEWQRNVSVGDNIEGEQLQRRLDERLQETRHNYFKFCFISLRWAG